MLKFSEDETIKFVDLYVEQECLGNLGSVHYRNKDMRIAAENEIIKKFGKISFGLTELKQKIKNLRCTYNQECAKIKKSTKSAAGTEEIYIPHIKWFDAFDKIMKLAKGGKKTDGSVETNISENTNNEEEEEGTAHEARTPEIQSSNALSQTEGTVHEPPAPAIQSGKALSKTPVSAKPPGAKKRKLENLTEAVQQLRDVSQTIQDSSNNEHEAFGNFVAATLNNLRKADALMAQHEIQDILLKYRLDDVDNQKKKVSSSFQQPNSTKIPQTTPCYSRDSYDSSLQSPYSTHSTDSYHLQYGDGTTSTCYAMEPDQTNIGVLNLFDDTNHANQHTNGDTFTSF